MQYIDVLRDMVNAYNHSLHRSIRKKPALVNNDHEDRMWHI